MYIAVDSCRADSRDLHSIALLKDIFHLDFLYLCFAVWTFEWVIIADALMLPCDISTSRANEARPVDISVQAVECPQDRILTVTRLHHRKKETITRMFLLKCSSLIKKHSYSTNTMVERKHSTEWHSFAQVSNQIRLRLLKAAPVPWSAGSAKALAYLPP